MTFLTAIKKKRKVINIYIKQHQNSFKFNLILGNETTLWECPYEPYDNCGHDESKL